MHGGKHSNCAALHTQLCTDKQLRTWSGPIVVARVCLAQPVELSVAAGNGPAPPRRRSCMGGAP